MTTGTFEETRWALIGLAAEEQDSEPAARAREELCRIYWGPVYSFVRRLGCSPHGAEDITQEVFARLLGRNAFASADPQKGRFRSFLIGTARHVMAEFGDRARAAKRGGGMRFETLEILNADHPAVTESHDETTPEQHLDRQWATTILELALRSLEQDFSKSGSPAAFAALQPYLTRDVAEGDYDALAIQLGLKRGTVPVAVHRFRRRYAQLVRQEVARTVPSVGDIDAEMRALFG